MCTQTGWTLDYVLWGISWINLQMMIVDKPQEQKVRADLKQIGEILSGAAKF